jgi:amidase
MKRRNFIKGIPFAGLMLATRSTGTTTVSNRLATTSIKLEEATIEELQQAMTTRKITSKQLVELYLDRIKKIDKSGPKLNAIIETNPDAVNIAEKLDEERKSGKVRSALHGIPVLVKDNIDTADRMMTTAGSLALVGHHAADDAFVVKQLRNAGAVILGKTNCSEWSNFRSGRSASGWSSRGGQTKNPCMLDRSPSGSSSGSAVAVAANLCAVAVGTETDGSIIAPSSYNGIVGIKPTVGLISRTGIVPISKTQDTAGPMARTVKDAAILLGILSGIDENDDVTKQSSGKGSKDYTVYLTTDALKEKRIGVEKSFLEGHQDVVALYKNAIAVLKSNGAETVEVDLIKSFYNFKYSEYELLQYEFKDGINRYLATANTSFKTLSDLIAYNKQHEKKIMPYFKQEIFESSNAKGPLTDKVYIDILSKREEVKKFVDELLARNKLDTICSVSIGLAGNIDVINGDYETGFYFCPPAAVTGYPHITVPMGKSHELPVGLSFMSGAYKEADIIALAYAYEHASHNREKPKFIPSSVPQ